MNITIILHENREHVPAVSTNYSHLAATPGAAYPPRLGLAYLGQYLGHILSKVYASKMSSVLQRLLHNLNLHSLLPSHWDSMAVGGWLRMVHDCVIPWGDFPYTTKNGILL